MLPSNTVETRAGVLSGPLHGAEAPSAEALLKRRRERLRMLPFVAASYAVDTVLLFAYVAVGAIPWQMPPAYLACGLLLCAAFHLVLDSALPERARDHHLVMEQMVANSALAMAFLLWTPQVGVPLMMGCFIIFAFGALRMKFRTVVFGSTILLKLMDRFPIIITIGAGLLGWVSGEMAATDPIIKDWVNANMHWLHWVAPAIGAIFVIAMGKWFAARTAVAHKPPVDLAGEQPKT